MVAGDLTGVHINQLKILEKSIMRGRFQYWKAICLSCQTKVIVADRYMHLWYDCGCSLGGPGSAKGISIDLTDFTVGKWTVIGPDYESKDNHYIHWKCRCICGNERSIRSTNLYDGASTSCGCARWGLVEYKIISPLYKDYTGQKFGYLTVDSFAYGDGKTYYWNVTCDCGEKFVTPVQKFRLVDSPSCGCKETITLQKTKLKEIRELKKELLVEYELNGTVSDRMPYDTSKFLNRKIGHLLVLGCYGYVRRNIYWYCKCDCGSSCLVDQKYLVDESIKFCNRHCKLRANSKE